MVVIFFGGLPGKQILMHACPEFANDFLLRGQSPAEFGQAICLLHKSAFALHDGRNRPELRPIRQPKRSHFAPVWGQEFLGLFVRHDLGLPTVQTIRDLRWRSIDGLIASEVRKAIFLIGAIIPAALQDQAGRHIADSIGRLGVFLLFVGIVAQAFEVVLQLGRKRLWQRIGIDGICRQHAVGRIAVRLLAIFRRIGTRNLLELLQLGRRSNLMAWHEDGHGIVHGRVYHRQYARGDGRRGLREIERITCPAIPGKRDRGGVGWVGHGGICYN